MLIATVIVARAHYTADFSAFLPRVPSQAQELLVQQLRNGPVSRLILIGIEGADEPARVRLSRDMAQRLRSNAAYRSIQNGEPVNLARDRDFLFKNRYLLSERLTPERFSGTGLQSALQEGIDLLSSSMGFLSRDLYLRDPTGETLAVLAQFDESISRPKTVSGVWVSPDHRRALLVAETRAEGSDSDGQALAIATIRSTFAQLRANPSVASAATTSLRLTGPGVFADDARTTIKAEALRLLILSSMLIATLLLCVYRSLPAVLLGFLPVACGALVGVAAVALGSGVVHGVTLGFGVTLIGESVDYSIYHFLQAPGGEQRYASTTALWPTIRLGLLTSVCGFASLLPSGFPGLAQLGLYSIAGLVAAGLVTRFVLPVLIPRGITIHPATALGASFSRLLMGIRSLRTLLWCIPLLAGIVLFAKSGRLWNHELSALSPVSQAAQAIDAELRADLGAPDVRTLVVVSGPDREGVLRATEAVGSRLQKLVEESVIDGFQTPARYLPSQQTQERRRDTLPTADELRVRLQVARSSLPVEPQQLAPFVEDIEATRTGPLISPADLQGTDFAAGVDALLIRQATRWNALLPLQAISSGPGAFVIDVARVRQAIVAAAPQDIELTVLDLKQATDDLYDSYLTEAIGASIAGLVAIVVLLSITLRSLAQVARVVTPLILAVLVVMSGLLLAGHMLTILHLVGLLLVFAIGSNYALFFARARADADPAASHRILASLLIANATTVIGFGVLAFSAVPVLANLGSTVAPGAFLALLFSAALAGDMRHGAESA
ncbi:MAG: MMPL family transporter [Steroidobacteraceae bacterium]